MTRKGVREILAAVPKDFQLLVGAVSVLHEALQMGGVGAILAVACSFPEMCVEAYEASRAGDAARAVATQKKLVTAASLFGPKYGIAGLKYVMDCVGLLWWAAAPSAAAGGRSRQKGTRRHAGVGGLRGGRGRLARSAPVSRGASPISSNPCHENQTSSTRAIVGGHCARRSLTCWLAPCCRCGRVAS